MNKKVTDAMRSDMMKNNRIPRKTPAENIQKPEDPHVASPQTKKAPSIQDVVTLSAEYEKARKIKQWATLAANMDDVRRDKVQELKRKIDAGTYTIEDKISGTVSGMLDEAGLTE